MELQMAGAEVSSELQTLVEQAVKDIKKGKAEKRAMRLNCDELALQLDDTSVRLPCFQTTACAPRFSHTRFPRVLLPQVVLSSLMECSAYNNLRLFFRYIVTKQKVLALVLYNVESGPETFVLLVHMQTPVIGRLFFCVKR